MSAAIHCPGPILLYVRFRNGTTSFLGTAVEAPEVEQQIFHIPVMNDLGGRNVPFQRVYDGEKHVITLTANRVDYTVYAAIRDLSKTPAGVGVDGPYDRGTLEVGYTDFELILIYTYGQSTVPGAQPDFPAGRRYYSAVLAGAKESTAGTRVLDIAMAFETTPVYDATTRTLSLYTETNFGALPTPT